MAARGLLQNPTLFTGSPVTTAEAVSKFVFYGERYGLPPQIFHHQLNFMLKKGLANTERRVLHALGNDFTSVTQWLCDHLPGFTLVPIAGDDKEFR